MQLHIYFLGGHRSPPSVCLWRERKCMHTNCVKHATCAFRCWKLQTWEWLSRRGWHEIRRVGRRQCDRYSPPFPWAFKSRGGFYEPSSAVLKCTIDTCLLERHKRQNNEKCVNWIRKRKSMFHTESIGYGWMVRQKEMRRCREIRMKNGTTCWKIYWGERPNALYSCVFIVCRLAMMRARW